MAAVLNTRAATPTRSLEGVRDSATRLSRLPEGKGDSQWAGTEVEVAPEVKEVSESLAI